VEFNEGASALTALATSIFERNLRALSRTSPDAARKLSEVEPQEGVRFFETEEGALSAETGRGQTACALASRRRPVEEARRLVGSLDLAESAVFIVSGFGMGYHVELLARKLGKTGIVVVFEPDVALLRAVLDRVDCSGWLGAMNVAIVTDPDDPALISRLIDGVEGLVAMGVTLVEHPAGRGRIGDRGRRFHQQFADVVRAVKMTVITTMMQVKTTMRNLTQNLDHYANSPGILELKDCCRGAPAIVVSAGPSLARNVHLLKEPWVRDRFVIVAVQTVLKPLLERGIRPHFVTALDYSEISRRFYEGLTTADVEGVTLVADPKVNPAVLDAWPVDADGVGGALRVQGDRYLDKLLGTELAKSKGELKPGATVAHLAYYLARHIGCDPISLIGQDLGFTDGQYYAAGASIHNTWACELNELNTLEMLEWQRIVRMGSQLRRATDVFGRPIFTDEQMATYLVQFERDFRDDTQCGLRIIDCTEGGVRKRHSESRTLEEFLNEFRDYAPRPVRIPPAKLRRARGSGGESAGGQSLRRIGERLTETRAAAFRVAEISRKTEGVLAEIAEHQHDQVLVNTLISKTERLRDQVGALEPALSLSHTLNQTGAFNRIRSDRALQMESNDGALAPVERQRRQVERDRENVRSLAAAADTLGELLDDAIMTLRGGAKITRESASSRQSMAVDLRSVIRSGDQGTPALRRVAAIVHVYSDRSDLADVLHNGLNALECTISRLALCKGLGVNGAAKTAAAPIVVVTDDMMRARSWLRRLPENIAIEFVSAGTTAGSRRDAVRSARILARECWRGGVANLSVYDEHVEPQSLLDAMSMCQPPIDAAMLVGADWSCVDPVLCDAVIERHLTNPHQSRFAFTQAAPGLCGCLIAREAVANLHSAATTGGNFVSIGGILGYVPTRPTVDLISLPECVSVPVSVRDSGERFIADSRHGREMVRRVLEGREAEPHAAGLPAHLELVVARGWDRLSVDEARREIEALAERREDGAVTMRGAAIVGDDPLSHPDIRRLCEHAHRLGLGVHVRTPLTAEADCGWLVESRSVDIVSVDLLAHTEDGYRAVTGRDGLVRVRERLEKLMDLRGQTADGLTAMTVRGDPIEQGRTTAAAGGEAWRTPWIVPRITRCDAVYSEVEPFYREWLLRCGWAVIDPLDTVREGERIAPLPVPAWVDGKRAKSTRVVGC